MSASVLPDVTTLVRMVDRGMTHQEIAGKYGVTRQAVTLKLKGATVPRLWRRDWPWDVETRHKAGWLYEALSFHVAESKGAGLAPRQRSRVDSLMRALTDLESRTGQRFIVDYDCGKPIGFFFRRRRDGDPCDGILAAGAGKG